MKLKQLHVPKIVRHKASGRSMVFLRDEAGKRRPVYLRGEPGTAEEQRHYREILSQHLAGSPVETSPRKRAAPESTWPTVGQLASRFLLFAQKHYTDASGQPTGETQACIYAFAMLLDLHRDTPTDRIGVSELIEVRQAMVDWRGTHEHGRQAPNGLSRKTINDRMHRVKRLFRWGHEQKLVPAETWYSVSALKGLQQGRGGAHDNPRVEAVPRAAVDAVLPLLVPTIAAAVELQWWSGMRPAEVLAMTRRQLDTSGKTWLYRCARHKGSWRGKERVIALGPKAQEILRPRLSLAMDAPLFSGRDAWEEFRAAKRARRQTAETKQMRDRDRRAASAESVAEFLDVCEYRRAIERACDRAKVERWSPHRLRHACGTRITKDAGLEVARAVLGHADASVTRRYAVAADVEIAKQTANWLG